MSLLTKFIRSPYSDKLVAIESLYWVIRIRLLIWIFPFAIVQKRVQKISNHSKCTNHSIPISRLQIMVIAASRYVPMTTCLVQALAGYVLFSKYGYKSSIKIGVLTENGEFEAHAWLEYDEKVVLGESEKNFKTILGID